MCTMFMNNIYIIRCKEKFQSKESFGASNIFKGGQPRVLKN